MATAKEKLVKKLTDLGVALTGKETVPALKQLLADNGGGNVGGAKGDFRVADTNGKHVATFSDREEADEYVKIHGGRIAQTGEVLKPIKAAK